MVGLSPASKLALLAAVLAARDDGAVHGKTLKTGHGTTYVLGEDGALSAWGEAMPILGHLSHPDYGPGVGDAPGEMGSGLPQLQSKLDRVTAAAGDPPCLVDATAPPSRAVQCWGSCGEGSCGHGRPGYYLSSIAEAPLTDLGSDAADRVLTVQGLSDHHACALFASGRVKCWGMNAYGYLGLGDTENRGDEAGEMGDNLPFVDLGTGVKAVQLAVSEYNACVVLEGRTQIKCWGSNFNGELGLGDMLETIGDEPGEMGDNLPAIDMGAEVEELSLGRGFACVLLAETREVKCWGWNRDGSLGAAHDDNVRFANATLPAVSVGGRVAKLTAGNSHSCVILEDAAKVKCWGSNLSGQLGLGLDLGDTSGTVPSELPDVAYGVPEDTAVEISAGGWHTCVRLASGFVRCWGGNYAGELGHGASYETWGKSPDHMGANLPNSLCRPAQQQSTPSPTASPSSASGESPSGTPNQGPSSPTSSSAQRDAPIWAFTFALAFALWPSKR